MERENEKMMGQKEKDCNGTGIAESAGAEQRTTDCRRKCWTIKLQPPVCWEYPGKDGKGSSE